MEETKELTKKVTAITMAEDIRLIINSIIENGGEITEDQEKALSELKYELTDKAEQIVFVDKTMDSEIAYFKQIKEAAEAQIKSREKACEWLKKYLARCMKLADIKSLKKSDGLFTVSLVKGREKVVVEDVNNLPFDYTDIVTTIKPKTKEIQTALTNGEAVSGAHLEYGEDYIMIRGGKKKE